VLSLPSPPFSHGRLNPLILDRIDGATGRATPLRSAKPVRDNQGPAGIGVAADGTLWGSVGPGLFHFSAAGALIRRIAGRGSYDSDLATTPDGSVWNIVESVLSASSLQRTQGATIARVGAPGERRSGLATGNDGSLWYGARPGTGVTSGLVNLVPQTGATTFYPLPPASGREVVDLAQGRDGVIWLIRRGNPDNFRTSDEILSFDPATKAVRGFAIPRPPNLFARLRSYVDGIAIGPDGQPWFTDGRAIGTVTTAGRVAEFTIPKTKFLPRPSASGIVSGPGNRLWFTAGEGFGPDIGYVSAYGTVTTQGAIRIRRLP
jgi:hypothetical protein